MILTKDNLIRFVKEKKYVIPSDVATSFDTSSMIASATLSELARDKLVGITHLKLSSTPYYYDLKQKEALIELGDKHFSKYEKEVFNKLKISQIINDNSLTIQERLSIEKMKDFANLLEIEHKEKILKFWVWYLKDIIDIRKQIMDILNEKNTKIKEEINKTTDTKKAIENEIKEVNSNQKIPPNTENKANSIIYNNRENHLNNQKEIKNLKNENNYNEDKNMYNKTETLANSFQTKTFIGNTEEESKSEQFIENYFKNHYLKLESKTKSRQSINYSTSLTINRIKIYFDCIYYEKKPTEAQIITFYTSSPKPKIVFIENPPKKLYSLAENLINLEIINI